MSVRSNRGLDSGGPSWTRTERSFLNGYWLMLGSSRSRSRRRPSGLVAPRRGGVVPVHARVCAVETTRYSRWPRPKNGPRRCFSAVVCGDPGSGHLTWLHARHLPLVTDVVRGLIQVRRSSVGGAG